TSPPRHTGAGPRVQLLQHWRQWPCASGPEKTPRCRSPLHPLQAIVPPHSVPSLLEVLPAESCSRPRQRAPPPAVSCGVQEIREEVVRPMRSRWLPSATSPGCSCSLRRTGARHRRFVETCRGFLSTL